MTRRAIGVLVQVAGFALGLSATFLYGEKVYTSLAVELIGSLLPLCALLYGASNNKSAARRLVLLSTSGVWFGNRLGIALSLAMLPAGFVPSWASPLLMGAALMVAWVLLRNSAVVTPHEETPLVDLRWQNVLEKLPGYESLSRREREVLELTLEGKTGKDAAAVLGIAPSTVGSYRARVFQKLGISSAQDALSLVARTMAANVEEDDDGYEQRENRVGISYPCGLLILSLCTVLSITGQAIYRPYLTCLIVLVDGLFLCISAWQMCDEAFDLTRLFTGLSAGFAACGVLYGSWNLTAVLGPLLLIAALSAAGGYSWGLIAGSTFAVSLFIPGDGLGGVLATAPASMLLLSALLLTIARLSESAKAQRIAADSVNLVATGERRAMSYLEGRGLSELRAKVCLLTAYGFDGQAIADALFVSTSTVSSYRSKSYEALGVHDKRGLVSLLKHDAGFTGLLDETGDAQ